MRVTNHQSATKDNRQMPPVTSCGCPMKIGPICTRPAIQRIGDGAKVGRPEELGAGAQRDTEAERAADLGQHRRLQQSPDDAEVHQYAGKGEHNRHQWQRQQWVEAGKRPEPECREHGEHEKLAVREVDDLHQPKN